MMFVKLSLLVFYLRLDQGRRMRWSVYSLMFIVLGLSIASLFILAFSCFPPAKFWDMMGTVEGHCIAAGAQQEFYDANGILNIVTDLFIYVTPIPMLWRVRISRVLYIPHLNARLLPRLHIVDVQKRKKEALSGIFALGILSIVNESRAIRVCTVYYIEELRKRKLTRRSSRLREIRLCANAHKHPRHVLLSCRPS